MLDKWQWASPNSDVDSHGPKGAYRVIVFFVVLIVGLYFQASLLRGHALDEDYAAYLQEAQNIALHKPVNDMGVIYFFDKNKNRYEQGPETYPLLLPILYALPVAYFGFDVELVKEVRLGLFVAGLFILAYAMLSWGFTVLEVSVSMLVFGLFTPIQYAVNSAGSDLPFLFFLIIALIAIEKATRAPARTAAAWGFVMGLTIYLATELRSVGIALLPTVWLVDFIRHRQILRVEMIAGILGLCVAFAAQYSLLGSTEAYGTFLQDARFFTPIETLQDFYWSLANNWQGGTNQYILLVLLVLAALAGIGVVSEALKGTAAAVFLICYTGLLVVLPAMHGGTRYVIPHLLFFGLFACRGAFVIASIARKHFAALPTHAVLGTAAAAVILFSLSERAYPVGLKTIGIATPAVKEAFEFIQATAPDSLIATTKYRSFHLFTSRRTILLLQARTPEELSSWLQERKIDYVVLKYSTGNAEISFSDCPGNPACAPDIDLGLNAKEVWHNSDFRVWRLER